MLFGDRGPTWDDNGIRKQKNDQKGRFTFSLLEVILKSIWGPGGIQICIDFLVFLRLAICETLCKSCAPKGSKGVPTGTILRSPGGTGGNVKTMVTFKRNHQFEGWREFWETSCEAQCVNVFQSASRKVLSDLLPIWCPKGGPWGALGNYFLLIFECFFRSQCLDDFGGAFGKSRRQRRGLCT